MAPAAAAAIQDRVIFVIGPPRSGSTLLQRMLGSHSAVLSPPEPHLVTPLAHLGVWANVERAAYDHINAAEAQREFIAELPGGLDDYWAACRAYLDVLYDRALEPSGKRLFADKTPAYALVLPFLTRVYPRARYLVLTRHPLAVFCSYANSFFEGDAAAAVAYNDILGRYLPAVARFLRDPGVAVHRLRYEDLVQRPAAELAAVFNWLGLDNEPGAVDYGAHAHRDKSYGDPKVRHRTRPTTDSLQRWATELAADPAARAVAERVVAGLDPADLETWGTPAAELFAPVDRAAGAAPPQRDWRWLTDGYRLRRRVFLALRKDIEQRPHGRLLRRLRYYCDVLLRE